MGHLKVRLADGSEELVIIDPKDAERDLRDFLARRGRFENGWVQLNGRPEYVRYDQIVAVKLDP